MPYISWKDINCALMIALWCKPRLFPTRELPNEALLPRKARGRSILIRPLKVRQASTDTPYVTCYKRRALGHKDGYEVMTLFQEIQVLNAPQATSRRLNSIRICGWKHNAIWVTFKLTHLLAGQYPGQWYSVDSVPPTTKSSSPIALGSGREDHESSNATNDV